jgi:DNA invertase Pin-like site-specific DNA recombinase
MTTTAYSYRRFSSGKQAKGRSIERQLAWSQGYATRKGWLLDTSVTLEDRGISAAKGRNATHGALATFRELVRIGTVRPGSVLLVENLDRLSREDIPSALSVFLELLNAGITIVTADPADLDGNLDGDVFTRESVSDLAGILKPLVIFQRAYEESQTKSRRIREAMKKKLEANGGKPVLTRGPAWLQWDKLTGWKMREDKAAIVRRIFRLATDGYGVRAIATELNRDKIPAWRGGLWDVSTIRHVLTNRNVIGELQTHANRKTKLDPVPHYYPAVIEEQTFLNARAAIRGRAHARGPRGSEVVNLFQGLLKNARDGYTMGTNRRSKKRSGKTTLYLMSLGRTKKGVGAFSCFPYDALERAFLTFVRELKETDLLPVSANRLVDQITARNVEISTLDAQLADVKEQYLANPKSKFLLDVAGTLEKTREAAVLALDQLKAEQDSINPSTVDETKSLVRLLETTTGDDLTALRRKLQARIRLLVSEMWICVAKTKNSTGRLMSVAVVQAFFRCGGGKWLLIGSNGIAGGAQDILPECDLRKGYDWFDEGIAAGPLSGSLVGTGWEVADLAADNRPNKSEDFLKWLGDVPARPFPVRELVAKYKAEKGIKISEPHARRALRDAETREAAKLDPFEKIGKYKKKWKAKGTKRAGK